MKKLIKTRTMLSNFQEEEREAQYGRPITSGEYRDVAKEMRKFEKGYNFYKKAFILIIFLIFSYAIVLMRL